MARLFKLCLQGWVIFLRYGRRRCRERRFTSLEPHFARVGIAWPEGGAQLRGEGGESCEAWPSAQVEHVARKCRLWRQGS